MKDVLWMFAYSSVGVLMIILLIKLTSFEIPAGMEIFLALFVVVILPLVVMFVATRRKKVS